MGWQYLKSIRQLLVGNEDSALRNAFEKCTHPCMRWHPIVLSESSAISAATVTRLTSCLLHLSIRSSGFQTHNSRFTLSKMRTRPAFVADRACGRAT
jgi:hypothetical protein